MSGAESYANQVDRANEYIRNYRQDAAQAASEAATTNLAAYYNKVKEMRDKYTAESTDGGEEIAGAAAAHMIIGKAKAYFKKSTNSKEPNNEEEGKATEDHDEDDGSGEQNVDDAGAKPEEATATEDAPTAAGDATGMGEGADTASGLGGEFTGRPTTAFGDEVGARIQARLKFLNNMDNAPPAGAEAADPNTTSLPRNAAEPAAQGGEVEGENPFSFDAFEGGRGAFAPAGEATEESAFGDLSNIPKPGTADAVMSRIDAQQATRVRGGNVGGDSTTTGGGEASGDLDVNTEADVGTAGEADTAGRAPVDTSDPSISPRGNIQTDPAGGGSALEEAGGELADAGGEAGAGLLGDIAGSAVLDAIPFVGEAAAVIQGLVGIGEGIAHLFDPDPPKPKPPPVQVGMNALTAKFSAALPDSDGALEDTAGSMSSF